MENLFHFYDDSPGYFQTFFPYYTWLHFLSHQLKSDISLYTKTHTHTHLLHSVQCVPLALVRLLSSSKFWAGQISSSYFWSRAGFTMSGMTATKRTSWRWGSHTLVSHHVHPMSPENMDLIPQRWCSRDIRKWSDLLLVRVTLTPQDPPQEPHLL